MTRCILSTIKYRQLPKLQKAFFRNIKKCYSLNHDTETLIQENTELTCDHMTPEIGLHLITPRCKLWHERGDNSPFDDPFWAFYWPGGQVLTRFILDNPIIFKDETVLDVGSGCGASTIAARLSGASRAVANDTDPVAIFAAKMNATANGVIIETESKNMIGQINSKWTTILLGDMFYDEVFRDRLVSWLTKQFLSHKTNIFIGDPGRLPLTHHPIKECLVKVAEYDLPISCQLENNGLTIGYVWKLNMG